MNAFDVYGSHAAPVRAAPRGRVKKEPSALDLKLQEKQRLNRNYRVWKSKVRKELFAAEPRLRDMMRYLRRVGPEDGEELIEAVSSSWLPTSLPEVRILAMELIRRRCDQIRRSVGLEPLDDPLPPEMTVEMRCRAILWGSDIR